jgi:molybdenum-dependent DNA-binding transcriptional regulator ModE
MFRVKRKFIMETRFLDSFVTIAECGSMAEAARRLNVTPTALAQRVRVLEDELDVKLIERARAASSARWTCISWLKSRACCITRSSARRSTRH